MTARLAACLTGDQPSQNVAIRRGPGGRPAMRAPSDSAARLNELVLNEIETDQYFTMVLARVEIATGRITLTQAGHPHPAVLRADGKVDFVGAGGLPIGLLPGAQFQDVEVTLNPGDRFFVSSDGITECMNPGGELLDDSGLVRLLKRHRNLNGQAFFDRMIAELVDFSGTEDFSDDVSAAMIDYRSRK